MNCVWADALVVTLYCLDLFFVHAHMPFADCADYAMRLGMLPDLLDLPLNWKVLSSAMPLVFLHHFLVHLGGWPPGNVHQ